MNIMSSNLEDIRRARDEWDTETARREEIHQKEYGEYRKAAAQTSAPLEYKLSMDLRKFDALDFEIDCQISSGWRSTRGLEVKIRCNENRVHDENSALSWDWSVKLDDDGNIIKESGSWSGLNATSEENMRSLHQTLEALDYLNSLNWAELIDVQIPQYSDFVSDQGSRGMRPNFEAQIRQAELESYIGTDTLIFGYSLPEYESRWNRAEKTWYIILGETAKQYRIGDVSAYIAESMLEKGKTIEEIIEYAKSYPRRIRKDRLLDEALKYPVIEFNEETAHSVMKMR